MSELDFALIEIVLEKCLRCNGIITKFFKKNWDIIKMDYLVMIIKAIKINQFLLDITYCNISLLFKSNAWTQLMNKQPITLFNIAHKFYA